MQEYSAMDFSIFDAHDAYDIALQRTQTLVRLPGFGSLSYRAWARGVRWPLRLEALARRDKIIRGAYASLESEYREIQSVLQGRPVNAMMDIGCGHALIIPSFYRDFGCRVHLVDIERTVETHHDYHATGSGYSSLSKAAMYLRINGIPEDFIRTTNPMSRPVEDGDLDLVISLLSCGFRYPISTYSSQVHAWLKPGGVFIFDLRSGSGQEDVFELFADWEVLSESPKSRRIAARKAL